MPFLEQRALYESLDFSLSWNLGANSEACASWLSVLRCPSSPAPEHLTAQGITDRVPCTYLACSSGTVQRESGPPPLAGQADSDGIFFEDSGIRMADLLDGSSTTVLAGETVFIYKGHGLDHYGQTQFLDHWYVGTMEGRGNEVSESMGSTGVAINSFLRDVFVDEKELAFSSHHSGGAKSSWPTGRWPSSPRRSIATPGVRWEPEPAARSSPRGEAIGRRLLGPPGHPSNAASGSPERTSTGVLRCADGLVSYCPRGRSACRKSLTRRLAFPGRPRRHGKAVLRSCMVGFRWEVAFQPEREDIIDEYADLKIFLSRACGGARVGSRRTGRRRRLAPMAIRRGAYRRFAGRLAGRAASAVDSAILAARAGLGRSPEPRHDALRPDLRAGGGPGPDVPEFQ